MFQSKYKILEAEDEKNALRIIEREKENLAIVLPDVVMPIMDGFSVLEIMNENGWIDFVPVIMITAEVSDNVMGSGYELGAMDIINNPFNPNIVNKRVENIIENFAYKDSLEKAAVRFVDIDNFKMLNDPYGHIFGDNVLKGITVIVQKNLKEKEVAERLSGDEFVAYIHDYETKKSLDQRLEALRSELKMK